MIEVEVKARSRPETREVILSMGGELQAVEHHLDIYFNSPLRDFRESDEALRIRVREGGARITYKGPKLDCSTQSRKELTSGISDPEVLEEILTSLGFVRAGAVRKVRTKYLLNGLILAMDDVEGLGSFIEIEASGSEDWSVERIKVEEMLNALGLGESLRKTYLEMLLESGHII
jgi:adenylate cyclase, class 2